MNEPMDTSLTLRQVLLEQQEPGMPDDAAERPQRAEVSKLEASLGGVAAAVKTVAAEQIVILASTVLDRRLVDVLMSGWQEWEKLVEAARRTIEDPNQVGIVELDDHDITWLQRPTIEVTYDGRRISDIEAEAAFDIKIHAATAIVERGRLTAIRSGRADVDAHLSIEGVLVAAAKQPIDLSADIQLGEGISLIEDPRQVTTLPEAEAMTVPLGGRE